MKSTRLTKLVSALAFVFLTSVVVLAATTTLFVYPGNLEGWQIRTTPGSQPTPAATPGVLFVFGPGTPPLGRGSVEFRVGSDGDASAEVRQPNFAGTLLPNPNPSPAPAAVNELSGLSYSTYAQSGGSGGQAPYIILNIDNNNDGAFDDRLFFEPVYQNGTYSTVDPSITLPNQCPGAGPNCVTPGQWQTWDALNGGWWSLNAGTFGPPLTTLKFYRSQNPDARIVNTETGDGGVRIVTGGGAGAWDNFVGNADAFSISVGEDTTIYDFEPKAPPTPSNGGVIISELRTSGPGTPAPPATQTATVLNGKSATGARSTVQQGRLGAITPAAVGVPADDDYVELYNTSDSDISVQSTEDSDGWALVKRGATCLAAPVVIAVIPNGTIIPARGHYLLAGSGYSLSAYPAGNGTTATPDQTLTADIQNDRNVALFNTTNPANFTAETRLDAVGFTNGTGANCDLTTEGTQLQSTRGSNEEYAFVRKMTPANGGRPQDTNNNAADFVLVSTRPQVAVGDNATPILGAPGPENRTSPIKRDGAITNALIAPTISSSQPPNRERRFNVVACGDQGTLLIRRTYTNNTGADVTRLRFRVNDITTVNSPVTSSPQAIVKVLDSQDETLSVPGRGVVSVKGVAREEPPNQPAPRCGGLNTSLSLNGITTIAPLANGSSIDVVFRLGVEQAGNFRFFVNVEALP
jgi:phosphotransferase system IIB component